MTNTYYNRIIELILDTHKEDLLNAQPGHCMKITGLGISELESLWYNIKDRFPAIETFIISESQNESEKFITATKLVELRNNQEAPLLVLIPSNSRTAAEDSYGNATFKEIPLEGIEEKLKKQLVSSIPNDFKDIIINDVFGYINQVNISTINYILYLLSIEAGNYSNESIGNNLYLLNLLPDSKLIESGNQIRSRLKYNIESVSLLSSFNKPLKDRVEELPLETNTLQKEIVSFIRRESEARSADEICRKVYESYPELNFRNWAIPDINFSQIKLSVGEIKSIDFKIEEARKVLYVKENKIAKVKIRFSTTPNPKDITDLKYFKIILMAVDGAGGEEVTVLRKLKNSASNRTYRDATVDLDSNMIEEGSYFFKILAEDENGNLLNDNDDFKDSKVNKAWKKALEADENTDKKNFPYKLTCDSNDFDYIVDDIGNENYEGQRKNKLNNVLQAYFKYKVEQLKNDEEVTIPDPINDSNCWLSDKIRHTSTFHIQYSDTHNYQISLSSKLREIESKFLENSDSFGYVKAVLKNNSAAISFDSINFIPSELTSYAPHQVLKLRETIFSAIRNSNDAKNGVFETTEIFKQYENIKAYIEKLAGWTSSLIKQLSSKELDVEQKGIIQQLLNELQLLDIARIKTKLPNEEPVEALLLSPLHPLRLAWTVQLLEVFKSWENKTIAYPGYKDSWSKNLEDIFEGGLSPENNPLVLVEPKTLKNYLYSGELSYGWGLYLNVSANEAKHGMTSVAIQMKHYLRQLFNITKDNYVETDISQKLVVRHIKNYLSQHPYTDKLIINLINSGDSSVFADVFVELEKEDLFKDINYEVRIFKGDDRIIEHGEALKNLINPESNISEEAEAFSQPSKNRLFPKLRFSINSITDYLSSPSKYIAHLSFLISPFSLTIELIKKSEEYKNFYLNGLITESTVIVNDNHSKWNRFTNGNELPIKYSGAGKAGIVLFNNLLSFIASALKLDITDKIPSTALKLNTTDQVLLSHLHDYSDWVITFDKNMGPQIFDQPSKNGKIPFLLDYIPGEELSGISSYLTTRPTSEVLGLLGPHFEEFNLDIHNPKDEDKIQLLLEDLRSVSSSLVLQLNSSKNKAFEVIGTAFTKRVLEKKGLLDESFLVPIDLHLNLFNNLPSESKSRADNLLISINLETAEIAVTVIEIKCRKSIGELELPELKIKMEEQMDNTIEALHVHYDPEFHLSFDRLDREIKNKELKSLLSFYIERAYRYEYLNNNAYESYILFLQNLDKGFSFKFKKLGLIFNFAGKKKHFKEIVEKDLTFFTFGGRLIDEILDSHSDLNTRRLEDNELELSLRAAIGVDVPLKPLLKDIFNPEIESEIQDTDESINDDIEGGTSTTSEKNVIDVDTIEEVEEDDYQTDCNHVDPLYDILIGKNSPSDQYGMLAETIHGKKIAFDLSETNTFSLFGIQGGGKSYTIGTVSEMVLKSFSNVNKLPSPLAGVIFHYSESMDYEPEFTSMIYPNDKEGELAKLKEKYGANPDSINDVIILTPKDKIEERKAEYPSIQVLPIAFNSKELNVQDWLFLLGAVGNDSAYIKQLKSIMKQHRRNITIDGITKSVEDSELLSNSQKALARQKLSFAREYIDDDFMLKETLKPGRLIIVDLRDEFIVKDEALGLFVIMLNVFSSAKNVDNTHFNKFIVFDEAHKYMDNKDLTGNIVTAIREMRHKGVSIMIASQDPPSLPNEIIELSSVILIHKFNSPQWLKHIQKSITQLATLKPADLSVLLPGEGFLWATKATDRSITTKPIKVSTRPRVTKHGGSTIKATGNI